MDILNIFASHRKNKPSHSKNKKEQVQKSKSGPIKKERQSKQQRQERTPYSKNEQEKPRLAFVTNNGKGKKLLVENLPWEVTNQNVEEVFGQFGVVQSAKVQYNEEGKSTGKAIVIYASQEDAIKALPLLNGALLDERPMKVSFYVAGAEEIKGRKETDNPREKKPKQEKKQREKKEPAPKKVAPSQDGLDADLNNYFGSNAQ